MLHKMLGYQAVADLAALFDQIVANLAGNVNVQENAAILVYHQVILSFVVTVFYKCIKQTYFFNLLKQSIKER